MEELNQLRTRIATLQAERDAINGLRRSREQVNGALDAWLSTAEVQGKAALQLAVDRAQAGQSFAPCHVQGNAAVFELPGAAPFSLDLGPLLIALMGKAVIQKRLAILIDALPDGMAPQEKAKRLAEIERELDEIEADEEALIVEIEQAGESVLRRADARPEIILA